MKRLILLIIFSALLNGCANPINLHTARKYELTARNAMNKGDWKAARMYYSRAWGNAKMGGADIRDISRLRYEYGRASGVVCEWEESEMALNEAFELDSRSNGPRWMPLVELERMSISQKDYKKAKSYFEKLMPILAEIQEETRDPLGYADLLDEYALVLSKSGDQDTAAMQKKRAKQLRDTFPGQNAHTEITPYGTQCN